MSLLASIRGLHARGDTHSALEALLGSGDSSDPAAGLLDILLESLKSSPFKALQVEAEADQGTVKRAYRRLALKFHPDKNPRTTAVFQTIQAAYDTLSDPSKRKAAERRARPRSARPARSSRPPTTSSGPGFHARQRTSSSRRSSRPQSASAAGRDPYQVPRYAGAYVPPPPHSASGRRPDSTQPKARTVPPPPVPPPRRASRSDEDDGGHPFIQPRTSRHSGGVPFGSHMPATGQPLRVPDKPFTPNVKRFTDVSVTLEWKPRGNLSWYGPATDHQLQWKPRGAFEWETAKTLLSGNACMKKNLVSGVDYLFRIRGKNSAGFGLWSDAVACKTMPHPAVRPPSAAEMKARQAAAAAKVQSKVDGLRGSLEASIDTEAEQARQRILRHRSKAVTPSSASGGVSSVRVPSAPKPAVRPPVVPSAPPRAAVPPPPLPPSAAGAGSSPQPPRKGGAFAINGAWISDDSESEDDEEEVAASENTPPGRVSTPPAAVKPPVAVVPPPPPPPMAAPPPPPAETPTPTAVWQELTDSASGSKFFVNTGTGESSWTPPPWQKLFDEASGLYYYEHRVTGDSSWTPPPDYVPMVKEEDAPLEQRHGALVALLAPSRRDPVLGTATT